MTRELDYDDVLLLPRTSLVNSREDVNFTFDFLGKRRYPIFSAPMKNVSEVEIIRLMERLNCIGILHKFDTLDNRLESIDILARDLELFGVACGLNEFDFAIEATKRGASFICIDIANGGIKALPDMIKHLKDVGIENIMSGNVATFEGVSQLVTAGSNLIRVGVGCLGANSRILLSNGMYKNIEDIVVGDEIIDGKGRPTKVISKEMTGIKKVKKYRNNSFHLPIYATDNHNFLVGDCNSVSKSTRMSRGYKAILLHKYPQKIVWKECDTIKQDCLLFPRYISFNMPNSFRIPIMKRALGNWRSGYTYKEDFILEPSYDSGYILGTFLGDGSAHCPIYKGNKRGSLTWFFGKNESNIVDKLSNSLYRVTGKYPHISEQSNVILVRFYHKPFAEFLNGFGKSTNKHLPENLLVNNREYLQGIYDGLLDSDGSICLKNGKNRVTFSSSSIKLTELFCTLSLMLGKGLPLVNQRKPTVSTLKNIDINNVSINYLSKNLINTSYREVREYRIVKLMEKENTDLFIPVYDIEVDSNEHSFIANNMIVHNSGKVCWTRNVTGVGRPQLSALKECKNIYKYYPNTILISDGGISNSGNAVKSFAFGARAVMLGSVLAKAEELNNEYYYGMASRKLQKEFYGANKSVEGTIIPVTEHYPLSDIIEEFVYGVKSACTYLNCPDYKCIGTNAQPVEVSRSAIKEI